MSSEDYSDGLIAVPRYTTDQQSRRSGGFKDEDDTWPIVLQENYVNPYDYITSSSCSEDDVEGNEERDIEERIEENGCSSFPWIESGLILRRASKSEEEGSPTTAKAKAKKKRSCANVLRLFFFFPPSIYRWIKTYDRKQLLSDLLGGLTVAIMVIPQGMSYAVLADLPPVYGLFAAITAPFVYTVFGTSRHLAIGPVALVSLSLPTVCALLIPNLAQLTEEEAVQAKVNAAISITLVSGAILTCLGFLRLGLISHLIPSAVMVGFTNAAAISIGISQIKELLGLQNVPHYAYTWQTCVYVLSHVQEGQIASALLGFSAILFLLAVRYAKGVVERAPAHGSRLRKTFKYLYPLSNLALIVFTSCLARLLINKYGTRLAIVKTVPAGLPHPAAPANLRHQWGLIAGHSLSMVLLSFMEAYAIAKKYALQEKYPLHVNRELVALGSANLVAAFFSSYPVSGSFSRTAVSYAAGTRTQMANSIGAALVMLVLRYLTKYFYYIPRATLGAIIEVALITLIDIQSIRREYHRSRLDLLVAVLTFVITLAFDTELGLLSGLAASLLFLYWMPRGGAALLRWWVCPVYERTVCCDVLVLDLERFFQTPSLVQSRLADYLLYETGRTTGRRRIRPRATPFPLLILFDAKSFMLKKRKEKTHHHHEEEEEEKDILDILREVWVHKVLKATDQMKLPRSMLTIVGLDLNRLHTNSCNSSNRELAVPLLDIDILSPRQMQLAEVVEARASSLDEIAAYGAELLAAAAAGHTNLDDESCSLYRSTKLPN